MDDRLAELRRRLGEVSDLRSALALLDWDQMVMMPPAGAAVRAERLATLERVAHERFIDDADRRARRRARRRSRRPFRTTPDDACLIRVTRRDWEKARRVPADLAAELTQAASEGMEAWVVARAENDYAAFRPWLDRHLELKREYIACFEPADDPYDILLDDYEPGTTTAEVEAVFDRLREELVPLIAATGGRSPTDSATGRSRRTARGARPRRDDGVRLRPGVVPPRQHGAPVLLLVRHERHPRHDAVPRRRPRVALQLHARDRPRALRARRQPRARAHAARLGLLVRACTRARAGCGRTSSAARCRSAAGSTRTSSRRSRTRSAGLTLERLPSRDQQGAAVVHPGRRRRGHLRHAHHPPLRARAGADRGHALDAPTCRRRGTRGSRSTSGSRCRRTRLGVLQDVHWSAGLFGYFPTYQLGNVMSVQIWEAAKAALPGRRGPLRGGRLHRARRLAAREPLRARPQVTPKETLERVAGGPLDPEPYLRYLREKYATPVGA